MELVIGLKVIRTLKKNPQNLNFTKDHLMVYNNFHHVIYE